MSASYTASRSRVDAVLGPAAVVGLVDRRAGFIVDLPSRAVNPETAAAHRLASASRALRVVHRSRRWQGEETASIDDIEPDPGGGERNGNRPTQILVASRRER